MPPKIQNLLNRVLDKNPLSNREKEVLTHAAEGKSNKQIADMLGVSESTIKGQFSNVLRKLNADDRTHAVTIALFHGWLDTENICSTLVNEESNIA